jgi:hypothetical protein
MYCATSICFYSPSLMAGKNNSVFYFLHLAVLFKRLKCSLIVYVAYELLCKFMRDRIVIYTAGYPGV